MLSTQREVLQATSERDGMLQSWLHLWQGFVLAHIVWSVFLFGVYVLCGMWFGLTPKLISVPTALLLGIALVVSIVVLSLISLCNDLWSEVVIAQSQIRHLHNTDTIFQAVIDSALDSIITINEHQLIVQFNPAAEQLFGYSAEDVIGSSLSRLIPERFRSAHQQHVYTFGQTGKSKCEAHSLPVISGLRANGEEFPLEATISKALVDEHCFYTVIARDIGERLRNEAAQQQLSERIQEAQKLESLAVLAGGIAHDFNNLLQTIMGNAELVLMDLAAEASARISVEQINVAARHAAGLTRQLLAYAGCGRTIVERVDLNSLLDEMISLLNVSIPRNVTLQTQLAAGPTTIEADICQIRQVVMNLIVNASEAIGDQVGVVTITTSLRYVTRQQLIGTVIAPDFSDGEHICLEIRDTGCGMDEATCRRIFEPFFTTKIRTDARSSHGLGLSAVAGIIRSHHGVLTVESIPGKGSCFCILLPAQPAMATRMSRWPSVAVMSSSQTVLVIDDEESIRSVVTRTLARQGLMAITAESGTIGLDLFRTHSAQVACVLVDATMPAMSGIDVLHEIRKLQPDVPVILMSGYSQHEFCQTNHCEIVGFLHKPFTPSDLYAVVQQVLVL